MSRVVVITGASSGVGRATAIELAKRGDRVVIAARREHALEETAAACRALPPMQSPEKVARAIAGVLDKPRRNTYVPPFIQLGVMFHAMFPRTSEQLLLAALRKYHFAGAQASTEGDLYASDAPGATHGDRPPLVSTPRFFAWLVGRFVQDRLE